MMPTDPIKESVLPVVEANRAELVTSDHELNDYIRLTPTPGHTPDHFAVCAGRGGDQAAQDSTASLLAQPFGQVLVGLVGLGIVGVAVFQAVRAWKGHLQKELDTARMGAREQTFAIRAGRLGLAARAATFLIIGLFLISASIHQEPERARGLAGALETLIAQPYGDLLLLVVSIGLIAYGAYMFLQARYRRMVL